MKTSFIERLIFRGTAQRRIRHVRPIPRHEANGLVADVYDQLERDFQLVPPITVHSPVPTLLAAIWAISRESLVAGTVVSRADREVVAAAVSRVNECPFCVDVHTSMVSGASRHDVVRGIVSNDVMEVEDSETRTLVEWAMGTGDASARMLHQSPFNSEEAPVLIGTALAFHYINRMVNVFMFDGSPLKLPPGLGWLKGGFRRLVGNMLAGKMMGTQFAPGASLALLPGASDSRQLPNQFSWAQSNSPVAQAFAAFASECEVAGHGALSDEVRDLVSERLSSWNGEAPGISRQWVERLVRDLDKRDQSAARLALLTAMASYQVDDETVRAFQRDFPTDQALVSATAWSSYMATRRISSWIQAGQDTNGTQINDEPIMKVNSP